MTAQLGTMGLNKELYTINKITLIDLELQYSTTENIYITTVH